MIIALDCDGVLADFITPALRAIQTVTGCSLLLPSDVVNFDIWSNFSLTPEQTRCAKAPIALPHFFTDLHPLPLAQNAVARMQEYARVICVTSPWNDSPTFSYERRRWLKHHFNINNGDIVFCNDKTLVSADALLDDCTHNVEEWNGCCDNGYLLDQPWNRSSIAPRFRTLDDFADHIIKWIQT